MAANPGPPEVTKAMATNGVIRFGATVFLRRRGHSRKGDHAVIWRAEARGRRPP